MSAQPRVPQVSDSDHPRGAQIDPASQAALERAESLDAPTIQPAPTGQDTQPGSLAAISTNGVPAYQRPTPRQARIHELRQKAQGKLAYVEFVIPEFIPLTPNHRHPYKAHVAWEQPDHHTLVDWYPEGKTTTLILWDRDRPDGQVVTATSAEADPRAAYRDCERQLRLKRHDTAVLLRKVEALKLTVDALNQIVQQRNQTIDARNHELRALQESREMWEQEATQRLLKASAPAATEHPLDATSLAILRSGFPVLSREGGWLSMQTPADREKFFRALVVDLVLPNISDRGTAWCTVLRAHTGRLEA
jgi:hypothetical protein